jgi:hypothetical protein
MMKLKTWLSGVPVMVTSAAVPGSPVVTVPLADATLVPCSTSRPQVSLLASVAGATPWLPSLAT